MRRRPFPLQLLASALLALVAACGPPPGAEEPISDAARALPPPKLGETAQFDDALARAQPDADRLGAGSAELAARAAALRARAAAMSGPVVDPATLDRLGAAVAPAQ